VQPLPTTLEPSQRRQMLLLMLPLISAALLQTLTLIFVKNVDSMLPALTLLLTTCIVFIPFFASHYLSWHYHGLRAAMLWSGGFLVYPTLLMGFELTLSLGIEKEMMMQGVGLAIAASLGHRISVLRRERNSTAASQWVSRLLSLNSVVAVLLVSWSSIAAGMFVSTVDPMNNQPIAPIIDSARVMDNFGLFIWYWLQFLFLASLIAIIYCLNRYVLIRNILSNHGVFFFILAGIMSIVVFTPILASLGLLLPLNEDNLTLIPSENNNPFDVINFQGFFAILAITTPVILAFERQQQNAQIEAVARQQTLTELKLLQQQINPHFLFNTLNNVYALTLSKSEQAPELLMQLANLLRYTVYKGQQPRVKLSEEVDYLENYLALQRIRLGERCQFDIELPKGQQPWLIPPLLLIVLVENAFKHGIEPSHSEAYLKLSIKVQGNQLHMLCENSLAIESAAHKAGGMGLENLRRRLTLLFATHFELICTRRERTWTASLQLELTPC